MNTPPVGETSDAVPPAADEVLALLLAAVVAGHLATRRSASQHWGVHRCPSAGGSGAHRQRPLRRHGLRVETARVRAPATSARRRVLCVAGREA